MSETVEVLLQVRDSQRAPTSAMFEMESINPGARVGRAAARALLCLVLAVGSFFIPLLHFVLVPGLLIAAVVFAVLAIKATVRVLTASVTCPKCGATTPIEAGSTGWPVTLWCKACGTTFNAQRAATHSTSVE